MATTAVIFHSLEQARTAARVAAELGVALTLLSASGASRTVGPGWFREVLAHVRAEAPETHLRAYLDCADCPGDVLEALRAPVPGVIFTGGGETARRLHDMAKARGIAFLDTRPAALDLLDSHDPEQECRRWLLRR